MEITNNQLNSTNHNVTHNSNKNQNNISTFKDELELSLNTNETKAEKKLREDARTKSLFDDIISMLKTGLTVEELERLEELLAKLIELKSSNDDNSKDGKMRVLIEKLEAELAQLQKRLKGVVIEEADTLDINKAISTSPDDFDSKIKEIQKSITSLKQPTASEYTPITSDEEFKLKEELRQSVY